MNNFMSNLIFRNKKMLISPFCNINCKKMDNFILSHFKSFKKMKNRIIKSFLACLINKDALEFDQRVFVFSFRSAILDV